MKKFVQYNIGVGEIKFGGSNYNMHPLCLISFTVLERKLSNFDAVSFMVRLDSLDCKVPTVPLKYPSKASEDPSMKVKTELETNETKATLNSLVSRKFPWSKSSGNN